ncbi:MAG: hypothetical protein Q9O74_03905 [Planctomycetota bacterium]|nr:hypothetical protein [Planctomycetota bacterium]
MPGKRPTTPLFEVLQESQAAARVGTRPDPSAEPQPQPSTTADAATPQPMPIEPQGGFSEAPIRIVGGVVQMPMVYAAVALAVAIGLILGAWSLGYRRGESQAAARAQLLESAVGSGAPGGRITEPQIRSANTAGTDADTSARTAIQPSGSSDSASGTPSIGTAAFLTPTGPTQTDPRQDRYNYLQLGSSIRVSEMRSIIELMASRDLGCFGVIDPGSRGRNDGPLYVLFASRGFPSGQANSREAVRYREQVLAAGAAWKKVGGVKDFDDAVWALYKQ